jgi:CrcB protein
MNPASPLAASAMVFAGGGAGAVLRYQLGRTMTQLLGPGAMTAFPWATLTVNVVGSLAMGLLAGWLARLGPVAAGGGEQWRLLLGVGLLGGFTTFSAFSLELMMLIDRGMGGTAFAYAAISVLAALTGLYLGLIAMRLA